MACGIGLPDAVDCAADHWSPALDGRREPSGQWRADCPVPGCGADRALQYDVPGKSRNVRWKSFCGHHDKEAMRPYVVAAVGPCMPGGSRRSPIERDELIDLALADLPSMTRQLRMLQLAGMGTQEALDKLGVRRENRSRVIAGKTGGASKRMQNRRS